MGLGFFGLGFRVGLGFWVLGYVLFKVLGCRLFGLGF